MERAAHLPYVPAILRTLDGPSFVAESNRLWDATHWMPGSPRKQPDAREVEMAAAAIAELHGAWRTESVIAPCPGVLNRLRLMREWLSWPSEMVPSTHSGTGLADVLRRVEVVLARAVPPALRALEPWEHVPVSCQPCLRDLRGDHVLFTEDRVTGIIDFGAMAVDHPAVDLARLLGDYAEVRDDFFALGLNAYREAGGELETTQEFLAELARTGALGSAINWLRRLKGNEVANLDAGAVEARLSRLLRRIERYAPG
jgi:homoserine kinase type II